jgi:hypothetical protein
MPTISGKVKLGGVGVANALVTVVAAEQEVYNAVADNNSGSISDALVVDDTNIFAPGGTSSGFCRKYDKNLLTLTGSVNYGGTIRDMLVDDTHIYVGGATTLRVRKYLKSNLSLVAQTDSYGGIIRGMWMDDTHIYVGGATTQRIRRYLRSNMSYVDQSNSLGTTLLRMYGDDTHIYVEHLDTATSTYPIFKYLKSDFSFVAKLSGVLGSSGSAAVPMTIVGDYLYHANNRPILMKIRTSDMVCETQANLSLPSNGATSPRGLATDGTHLFVGSTQTAGGSYLTKFDLNLKPIERTKTFETAPPRMYGINVDDTYVYFGKYLSSLTKRLKSEINQDGVYTDANGDYSITVDEGTYHLVARYEVGGVKYTSKYNWGITV